MKSYKLTVRISEIDHDRLRQYADKYQLSISEAFRELALRTIGDVLEVDVSGYKKFGKQSLMRTERAGIYSSVLTNLILREQIPEEQLNELQRRAKNIVESRWDYWEAE